MREGNVWLVAGLGYGDEGKGSIVDYLVGSKKACAVVRYNGGAQAGHRVVLQDGKEHIFSQFGSGTMAPGVLTYLSRFMIVEPIGMMREYEHLRDLGFGDAFLRTAIDGKAPLTTPFHIAANRLLELSRGGKRHGSCGLGIGETMEDVRDLGGDALVVGDLEDARTLRKKLLAIRERKLAKVSHLFSKMRGVGHADHAREVLEEDEAFEWCIERYTEFMRCAKVANENHLQLLLKLGPVVFEGAQGVLLDPRFGFPPYVTKTDITYRNAEILLNEAGYDGRLTKVGVIRAYFTRHGAGPFVSEDAVMSVLLQDSRNMQHDWQGSFRVGYFDVVAARYALEAIGGVDEFVITNLDRLIGLPELKICVGYAMHPKISESVSGGLFSRSGDLISDIHLSQVQDETRQMELTNALMRAEPVYEKSHPRRNRKEARDYAQRIAEYVAEKLSIISFGPRADDKEIV